MFLRFLAVIGLCCVSGCGNFAARRILQAPNTYPAWLAPKAPVELDFSEKLLTAFTNRYLKIADPAATIRYKIVPPADYQFRWTNQVPEAGRIMNLSFSATISAESDRTNRWTAEPRGTVFLLHGYGVAGFAMLPWAFILAQDGWRCVLVDLRGHGKSTGKQIYLGMQEVTDLRALLDQIQMDEGSTGPVEVVGHSFGAVLALRWKMTDPRIDRVVAMSPYADFGNAVLNVSDEYAPWIPKCFLRAGLRRIPQRLGADPCQLNPGCWLKPTEALFIAGELDKIAPVNSVQTLEKIGGANSKFLVVPRAAHEPLPFFLDDLAGPVTQWLDER